MRPAEEPAASAAFPLLKKPHILICNICAGRAVQNGCSSEDDGGVCSNLGLGHSRRFCTDVSVHNVAPSSVSVPREGYFKGERCVFFFICSCRCNWFTQALDVPVSGMVTVTTSSKSEAVVQHNPVQ